jgi:hypothetical protein
MFPHVVIPLASSGLVFSHKHFIRVSETRSEFLQNFPFSKIPATGTVHPDGSGWQSTISLFK